MDFDTLEDDTVTIRERDLHGTDSRVQLMKFRPSYASGWIWSKLLLS
ncbi:MAG: hypothetical protein R2792_14565 [Saprospiraceae bacterium]